jgi:hypothetical protein
VPPRKTNACFVGSLKKLPCVMHPMCLDVCHEHMENQSPCAISDLKNNCWHRVNHWGRLAVHVSNAMDWRALTARPALWWDRLVVWTIK